LIKATVTFFLLLFCSISLAQVNLTKEKRHLDEMYISSLDSYNAYNFKKSKKTALQLLEQSYAENSTYYTAIAYNLLGLNDEAVEDFTSAKEKYTKSKEISIRHNYAQLLMYNYNGLGSVWVLKNKNFETSEKFYKKALHIADSLNHTFKYDIIVNIVWNRLDNHEPQKISKHLDDLFYITTSLDKQKDVHERTLISTAYLLLARYYAQTDHLEMAEINFDKSIEVLDKMPLYEQLSEIHFYRSTYEAHLKNYENAYSYLNKHIENKAKFVDQNLKKRLVIENVRYGLDEYERALVVSEREKVLMQDLANSKSKSSWLYSILSIILLAVLIFIYRENKVKNKLIKNLNTNNRKLKKAKKQAEIAAEVKSQFISNISHEIRTPLHGVIGITSLLLENENTSKDNKKLLNSLKFSGNYLLNLINNILFLNKIDKNKIKLKPEVIHLQTFFNNILAAIQFSSQKYNCEVVFKIDSNLPSQIISDGNILYEILLNLIENAIKFSHGKVRVEVNLINKIDHTHILEFKVIDNGIGIPREKQKMIFDNFSQIPMDKSIMEGTGIGLSIVKKLLFLMNSEINLESEIGKGSTFYFEILCETPLDYNLKQSHSFKIKQLKGKKIIHIEDNQINRLVVEKFFNDYDVNLLTFQDGQDGLVALTEEEEWDIALIDINIPTLDGYEIVKSIRKTYPSKPIIAVTASELSEIKEKVINAGMTDVLIKPFSKETLINMVTNYL